MIGLGLSSSGKDDLDDMDDRLTKIQAALDAFRMDEARALAQAELAEKPSAAAYYLAAQAALNHGQRVEYLQKAVELDPQHQAALAELADMQPREASQPKDKDKDKEKDSAAPSIKLAGITKRFAAFIIDAFIISLFTVALMIANDAIAPLYDALASVDEDTVVAAFEQLQSDMIVMNLLISACYNVALMTWFNGQTLGKMFLRIRVIKANRRRFTLWDALLRNVFGYTVSQIFLLGYLWAIVDDYEQTWHDKMARTFVIEERKKDRDAEE